MSDGETVLDRGLAVAAEHPALALVPLVSTLLAVEKIQRVARFDGVHGGFTLPMPSPVLDLWAFVSVPNAGIEGPTAVPLLALPLFVAVRGALAAGYLGSIDDALADRRPAFVGGVRAYAVPQIGYQVLVMAAILAVVPLASVSVLLLVPAVLGLLAAGYLFYGTPYLVVTADEDLGAALAHSYRLATTSRSYAVFFVALLVGGAVLSVVATTVVVSLGLAGVLFGAVLSAPLAVAVNAAAMALFRDVGDGSAAPDAGGDGDAGAAATDDEATHPVDDGAPATDDETPRPGDDADPERS